MLALSKDGIHDVMQTNSGAAAHPANHFIAGKAVLNHPCHEPVNINRIRQIPRHLVS